MTNLDAFKAWLEKVAPGQDASHNLEALNKISKGLGGPGNFTSNASALYDVQSRWEGGGGGDYAPYDGSYEVTPSTEDQVLETAGKGLDEDVTVKAISPVDVERTVMAAYSAGSDGESLVPVPEMERDPVPGYNKRSEGLVVLNDTVDAPAPEDTFTAQFDDMTSSVIVNRYPNSDFWRTKKYNLPETGADMDSFADAMIHGDAIQFQIYSSFLRPENIKKDTSIFGVKGTYEGETPEFFGGPYEVTPSTVGQTLHTANLMMDEDVRVGAVNATIDENIRPENIKKDIQILGVMGTLEGGEDVPAYDGSYTVTPTTAPQTLLTQGKKMTGNLEVEAVTSAIDDNIKADLILSMDPETNAPVSILGVAGGIPISESIDIVPSQDSAVQDRPEDPLPVVGGISDLKIHRKTFTERTATYLKADSPISYFSYVSDEEAAKIIPENIRNGVSILGVAGTYEGSAAPAPVIALSKAAVPGPSVRSVFFNGKHYLFGSLASGMARGYVSTDGVNFSEDTAFTTAIGQMESSTDNRYSMEVYGAGIDASNRLVVAVGYTDANTYPRTFRVQFLYSTTGTDWNTGEVAITQEWNDYHINHIAVCFGNPHIVLYSDYSSDGQLLFFTGPDVSPLTFTFQEATAGITAGTGSLKADDDTVKMARWSPNMVLISYKAWDTGAWYFGKLSIDLNQVQSEPVMTKAFIPEDISSMQYLEDERVAIGLTSGEWIALTALEEEDQPGETTPIFSSTPVLSIAFDENRNGIAGGSGGSMAFCSAGGSWKVFAPINGGTDLVSASYGSNAFVVAADAENAAVVAQV